MRKLKFALIFNLILMAALCFGQPINLQKDLITAQKPRPEPTHYTGLHGFYKKYISSQDGSNCQFHPSCSHYAKLAIKKHPLPIGLFLTADRLLRCNGRTEDYFTNDSEKAIDLP
jgi:putative component of membrane protein insertase Oxa1/YidC/SpoIIIJ protein YidD